MRLAAAKLRGQIEYGGSFRPLAREAADHLAAEVDQGLGEMRPVEEFRGVAVNGRRSPIVHLV